MVPPPTTTGLEVQHNTIHAERVTLGHTHGQENTNAEIKYVVPDRFTSVCLLMPITPWQQSF